MVLTTVSTPRSDGVDAPPTGHQRAPDEENAHGVRSGHERGNPWARWSASSASISRRGNFQLHGATEGGEPVLRRRLTRSTLLGFLAKQPVPV